MTNREKLNTLPARQYISELERVFNSPARQYMDLEKWLDANSEEYPSPKPEGERVIADLKYGLMGEHKRQEAILITRCTMFGQDYYLLYIENTESGRGQILKAPAETCTILKEDVVYE